MIPNLFFPNFDQGPFWEVAEKNPVRAFSYSYLLCVLVGQDRVLYLFSKKHG